MIVLYSKVPDVSSERTAIKHKNLPWKRNSPRKFEASPNEPTITTSFGFFTSDMKMLRDTQANNVKRKHAPGVLKKRSIASMKIEKHRASKNTPFTRAARISARCQPYEYFVSDPAICCRVVSYVKEERET